MDIHNFGKKLEEISTPEFEGKIYDLQVRKIQEQWNARMRKSLMWFRIREAIFNRLIAGKVAILTSLVLIGHFYAWGLAGLLMLFSWGHSLVISYIKNP